MTLKSAALFALVATALLAVLELADFIHILLGVMRDLIPAMTLIRAFIYLVASVAVTVFFFVFHRAQGR